MEVSAKERQRAEHLLQSQRIQLHRIKSFSFMKRYHQASHKDVPTGKDKYGPGIFVFHLKDKQDKVFICRLSSILHPSSVFWYLKEYLLPTTPRMNEVRTFFPQQPTSVPRCICSGSLYYSLCF